MFRERKRSHYSSHNVKGFGDQRINIICYEMRETDTGFQFAQKSLRSSFFVELVDNCSYIIINNIWNGIITINYIIVLFLNNKMRFCDIPKLFYNSG